MSRVTPTSPIYCFNVKVETHVFRWLPNQSSQEVAFKRINNLTSYGTQILWHQWTPCAEIVKAVLPDLLSLNWNKKQYPIVDLGTSGPCLLLGERALICPKRHWWHIQTEEVKKISQTRRAWTWRARDILRLSDLFRSTWSHFIWKLGGHLHVK